MTPEDPFLRSFVLSSFVFSFVLPHTYNVSLSLKEIITSDYGVTCRDVLTRP